MARFSMKLTVAVVVLVACLLSLSQAAPTAFTKLSSAQFNLQTWRTKYEQWRCIYVSKVGGGIKANQLRVVRPPPVYNSQGVEDPRLAYDTVSEGVAYGMILSAYANDQTTFNGLWSYAQSNFLSTRNAAHAPCMQYHILNDGTWYSSIDCATDAELDMVYALLAAHNRWGTATNKVYLNAAQTLANTILKYEVESGTNLLKPGTRWGGSSATNPSYLATGFFKLFANVFSDSRWTNVLTSSYNLIAIINTKNKNTGLFPDWCTISGTQSSNVPAYTYYYDAFRTPWRLASDAYWYRTTNAINQCNLLNAHWHSNGDIIGEEYITGGFTANTFTKTDASFYVTALSCSMFDDSSLRAVTTKYFLNFQFGDYYKDSLYMLVGLLAIGEFGQPTNPLALPAVSPHTSGSCPANSVTTKSKSATTPTRTVSKSATPTKTVTKSPTPTKSISKTPTPTRTRSKSPSPTKSVSKSPSPSKSLSKTPSLSKSTSATRTRSKSPSPTKSLSKSATPTKTVTKSPTPTKSISKTPTPTRTRSKSPSPTKSISKSPSPTKSVSKSPSPSKSLSKTPSLSKSTSATKSLSKSATATRTLSKTPTPTKSLSKSPSATRSQPLTSPSRTASRSPSLRK